MTLSDLVQSFESIEGLGFSVSLVCKVLQISKQFQNKWGERLATCSIHGQPPSLALLPTHAYL